MDGADDREHLVHDRRGEPERGLVQQQQPRARHQRAADRHHLLLAAGERARGLAAPLGEDREELVHARQRGLARAPRLAAVAAHLEVLLHRHAGEEPPPLGDERDPVAAHQVRRHRAEVDAAEPELAAARPQEPGDRC